MVNSYVGSALLKTTQDINHSPFIHATDFCLVDTTLHDNPDLVIDWIHFLAVRMHGSGGIKSGVSWCRRSTVSRA